MEMVINSKKFNATWYLLLVTYAITTIVIGLDKCFGWWLVDWAQYVSPMIMAYIPLSVVNFVIVTGVIEIVAGIVLFIRPRFGAYLVVAWMLLVVIDLLSMNKYYDIIARDVVIGIGALAFAWLTEIKETARSR